MTSPYVKADHSSLAMPNVAFTELMAAVLDKGVPFRFQASGSSMSPFIRDGDVLTIAPARVRLGDVVGFVSPRGGKLVVHRVVCISRGGYFIKGDNASESDVHVPPPKILGRVVRVEHRGNRVPLGLGIERVAIAFLSRRGWLIPAVWATWCVVRPVIKRK